MSLSTADFLLQLSTSIGSTSLVGFLFWNWIKSKLEFQDKLQEENRGRIRELENNKEKLMSRDDHHHIRKEDKESIEKQLQELKQDIKDMPAKVAALVKSLL